MAGAALRLNTRIDDRRPRQAFQRLQRTGGNRKRALRDIGESWLNSTQGRLEQQVSPDGSPWQALTERYRRRKKRNKDKILVLRGWLHGRLTYQADEASVAVGTPLIYGATHQFGDADRGIPARPYLGMSGDDRRMIVRTLHRHIRRTLRA